MNLQRIKWMLFSFDGRLTRKQAWAVYLLVVLPLVILAVLIWSLIQHYPVLAVIPVSLYLAALYITLAIQGKRLHDVGISAWANLAVAIPILGIIIWLMIYCTKGQRVDNKYGPSPYPVGEHAVQSTIST